MADHRARHLRKNMTKFEEALWKELRDLKTCGFHFRRQVSIDGYIVDFACYSQRLVIEVDGAQHLAGKQLAADTARDAHLAWQGFTIMRFTNTDIAEALDGVMMEVLSVLGVGTAGALEP